MKIFSRKKPCCLPERTMLLAVVFVSVCMFGERSGVSAVEFWKRLGPLGGEHSLGASCKSSLQCLLFVGHSHCDWDSRTCTCQPYHVQLNESCLPGKFEAPRDSIGKLMSIIYFPTQFIKPLQPLCWALRAQLMSSVPSKCQMPSARPASASARAALCPTVATSASQVSGDHPFNCPPLITIYRKPSRCRRPILLKRSPVFAFQQVLILQVHHSAYLWQVPLPTGTRTEGWSVLAASGQKVLRGLRLSERNAGSHLQAAQLQRSPNRFHMPVRAGLEDECRPNAL